MTDRVAEPSTGLEDDRVQLRGPRRRRAPGAWRSDRRGAFKVGERVGEDCGVRRRGGVLEC